MHEQSTPSRARSRIGPRWRTRRGIGRTAILGAVGGLIALSGLTLGVWIYASRASKVLHKMSMDDHIPQKFLNMQYDLE